MSAVPTEPADPVHERAAEASECPNAARDDLATRYRHYVLKVARQIAETIPVHVETDDLVGWGHMGLLEAATRFDPSRGASFRTFAHHRIRGAIYDGLRRELGPRPPWALPADDALAKRAGECGVVVADAGYECELDAGGAPPRRARPLPHRDAASAQDHQVWLAEIRDRLERALGTLTPLERAVLDEHYLQGHPVQALVARSNYSKSWLSRIHARALAKMRTRLLAGTSGKGAYL